MEFNVENLVRDNIRRMSPYSSARNEFSGTASVWLDANENAFGSPLSMNYNRYPDPMQMELKKKISDMKGVPVQNIFLGNGSDEAIDLLFRVFCEPGWNNVIICPPTYGMYAVCAAINDIRVKKISLTENFQLDLAGITAAIDTGTTIIFLCTPNNPTGNSIKRNDIEQLLNDFKGLVVIDEAYIDFGKQPSFVSDLPKYPNLVILQTLSKAWGLAALRLGMAFAGKTIINYFNKVKYPYNINAVTQQLALEALGNISSVKNWTKTTIEQREWLKAELKSLAFVEVVYPSDANFILVKVINAGLIYENLNRTGIIVRDRSRVILCDNCLRITVGTPDENKRLIETLKGYIL
jgi:histidinol-phosphate aminotransferase